MQMNNATPPEQAAANGAAGRLTTEQLVPHLAALEAVVPPLWPLADYVAVNPFLGLADRPFLVARQLLADVRVCDILPTADWFRQRLTTEAITPADLETALAECCEEHPDWFGGLTVANCLELLNEDPADPAAERRYRTVSERVDEQLGTRWNSHIITDISRHCAAGSTSSAFVDSGNSSLPSRTTHLRQSQIYWSGWQFPRLTSSGFY
jgi:uncharacterized protein YbcC (UPF0753/DUF2309 family)